MFLDACCLINLFATGRLEAILEILPYRFATSSLVADEEVLRVGERPGIELQAPDLLRVVAITGESEQAELVRFAMELDDGEASVCALATARGGGVATDDRKALRVLGRVGVQVLQTPELLYEWSIRSRASHEEIRQVLTSIRAQGRFYPRRDAPCFPWWESFSA